jgi:hypothetical protein
VADLVIGDDDEEIDVAPVVRENPPTWKAEATEERRALGDQRRSARAGKK